MLGDYSAGQGGGERRQHLRRECNPDEPLEAMVLPGDPAAQSVDLRLDALGGLGEILARFGETQPPPVPLEEMDAETFLEVRDTPRHGRVADPQRLGRGSHASLPPDRQEQYFGRSVGSQLSRQDSLDIASFRFTGDTIRVLAVLVEWNDRVITDGIRRLARNEDTAQWEVIEFDPD